MRHTPARKFAESVEPLRSDDADCPDRVDHRCNLTNACMAPNGSTPDLIATAVRHLATATRDAFQQLHSNPDSSNAAA